MVRWRPILSAWLLLGLVLASMRWVGMRQLEQIDARRGATCCQGFVALEPGQICTDETEWLPSMGPFGCVALMFGAAAVLMRLEQDDE